MHEWEYSDGSGTDLTDKTSELGAAAIDLQSCSTATLDEEPHTEVMNAGAIVKFMNEMIAEVGAIIDENETVTRVLLAHFNWDRHALLERFYGTDKRVLFKEAKVANLTLRSQSKDSVVSDTVFLDAMPSLSSVSGEPNGASRPLEHREKSNECGICLTTDGTAERKTFSLTCGHRFCISCWREYLHHSVLKEGMAHNLSCAAYGCSVLIGHTDLKSLMMDEAVREKYHQLVADSFVSCNKNLRWCPRPNCGKAIKAERMTKQVVCQCGEVFCFQCGEECHAPVLCDWIKHWQLRINSDSSTVSWIASNTKECPRCKATIEKDGGCNHMVCRKDNCMYEFCWVCLGPWQEHGQNAWYNCNRFNEKTSKNARNAMEKSRSNMLRFLHYYNRYANHQRSMKFESEINNKVNARIEEVRRSQGRALNEINFLKVAVDTLCRARRTLMNTYVFAYFVRQNNQSIIFEDNQRDLEVSTEHLSEYLERDIYKSEPAHMKQKVNDKMTYCGQRCTALLSHIQEGYDSGWWEMDESCSLRQC